MSDIRAVAEKKGIFQQGSTANLLLKITDFDGTPIDPSSINCKIEGPSENLSLSSEILSITPYQADTGFYVTEWNINSDQITGTYDITWEYTVNENSILTEKTELQEVVIAESYESTEQPDFYKEANLFMREALTHHICCAQSIPIYFEQSRPSIDNKTFQFTFPRWNQSTGIRIYRNQNIVNEGVEVDYFNGKVTFDSSLSPYETVNIDYNFRWFSDEDLQRFIENGIDKMNIFPPHSGYTVDNIPPIMVPIVLYGAAVDALRQLIMCLQFQQPQQVFGGREAAQQAAQGFETLKKNFESDWEKLGEQKKLGRYPRTLIISTPEYSLPGGRSRWFRMLFKG